MPRATLTRRLTFSAAHRYRRPEWSDAKNAEVFGACAHPNWHGHTYTCEVTVGGEVDPITGFCADLAALDGGVQVIVAKTATVDPVVKSVNASLAPVRSFAESI